MFHFYANPKRSKILEKETDRELVGRLKLLDDRIPKNIDDKSNILE